MKILAPDNDAFAFVSIEAYLDGVYFEYDSKYLNFCSRITSLPYLSSFVSSNT